MEMMSINDNHKYIYNTYKELNKLMPHNYLKIKVLASKKYNLPNKTIIDLIETKYNPNIINNKKEKPKKNIYLFSSELNENNISENSSLKDLFFLKNLKNISNRNKSNIKNYNNSEIINSINNNKSKRRKGIFNSKCINNFYLRNNIRLPEITQRMKFKIPRNEREKHGFKIIGNETEENKNNNNKMLKTYVRKISIADDKNENKNRTNYCLSEEKNNKIKELERLEHLPFNIISIYNKNKNRKSTFYNNTIDYKINE